VLIGANEYRQLVDVPIVDVAPTTLPSLPAAIAVEPLSPVRFAAAFEQTGKA
jgi:hypothetical protein